MEDTTAPEATEATESVEVVADAPEEAAAPEESPAERKRVAVEEAAAPADEAPWKSLPKKQNRASLKHPVFGLGASVLPQSHIAFGAHTVNCLH